MACNRGGIVTLLEGKNISKKYIMHGKGMEACKNCSITIRSGEVVTLIGQSGSGKTTLASILSRILYADEISSMLDPSTKSNILRLLKGLQNSKGFSMLYITHDLSLARKIADEVYIMYNGEIIEKGSVVNIFNNPQKDYTKELVREGLNY